MFGTVVVSVKHVSIGPPCGAASATPLDKEFELVEIAEMVWSIIDLSSYLRIIATMRV